MTNYYEVCDEPEEIPIKEQDETKPKLKPRNENKTKNEKRRI